MRKIITILVCTITASSCSTSFEVVHPFKNLSYSGDRLFPVETNYSEFTFRVWISNSTSVDRVISIYEDSAADFQGKLIEFGKLYKDRSNKDYYREVTIVPKDGFIAFKQKLDSLSLYAVKSKPDIETVEHQPFSTYIIEIKYKKLFNIFRFDTYYPYQTKNEDIYSAVEKLIFEEFDLKKYFKFKNNAN